MTKREEKILDELFNYIEYITGEYLNLKQKERIKEFFDRYKKYNRKENSYPQIET